MHLCSTYFPKGSNSYKTGLISFTLPLSSKGYLQSHFLSEKDTNSARGEYGSINFLSCQYIFMNAPGLNSLISFTNEKSPLILFLIVKLRFS